MDKDKLNECGCGCGEENNGGCGCGGHDHEHEHECGCGCGEGDHESLIVDLEDENGNVVPCEVVDGFEYKNSEYAIVQNPENGAVYLFKVVGEGDEGELVIPDDSEFEEVSAYYEQLMDEQE
ncbi:DUF1292 domain-containing protein [Clostridium sp. CX1]|uniref:DUF1292 domain-containing protein n=1 Tax=Clostridium sp. CX1 TaxID=2978346 RepID=UPI0021C22729|nr:DUF1292 domain-containing protein [Clostridium sp. CX1]MCT8976159.1 DUF1292 domain-containing protein [Clostridium sp. CX1]